jgi:DNA-binding beta-propeller fold protein YncE
MPTRTSHYRRAAAKTARERQAGRAVRPSRRPRAGLAVLLVTAALMWLISCGSASRGLPPGQRVALPLRQVADVPLPDGASRFDYQSIDPHRHVLYIAHLGASSIVAFNVATRRVEADLHGIDAVHGVLAVPGLGKLFASATGSGQAVTISEATGRFLARARAGAYPDGIAYDPVSQEAFVSDESGGIETVIDARDGHRIATIHLDGQAGNVQYDPGSGDILVDVQTRNVLAVIDPGSERVVRSVPLPGCDHDHGLSIDAARRLAFVACDGNARLLALDLTNFAVRQEFRVGTDPDVLAFDPGLRRLYVAAESGVVTVLAERGRSLITLGRAFLAPEAHTVAVDPGTNLVYFALQDIGGKPVLRIMAPRP